MVFCSPFANHGCRQYDRGIPDLPSASTRSCNTVQDLRSANSALAEELARKQREAAGLAAELAGHREAAAAARAVGLAQRQLVPRAPAAGIDGDISSGDARVQELQWRCVDAIPAADRQHRPTCARGLQRTCCFRCSMLLIGRCCDFEEGVAHSRPFQTRMLPLSAQHTELRYVSVRLRAASKPAGGPTADRLHSACTASALLAVCMTAPVTVCVAGSNRRRPKGLPPRSCSAATGVRALRCVGIGTRRRCSQCRSASDK